MYPGQQVFHAFPLPTASNGKHNRNEYRQDSSVTGENRATEAAMLTSVK